MYMHVVRREYLNYSQPSPLQRVPAAAQPRDAKGMLEIVRADSVIDHRERRLLRRAIHAWADAAVEAGNMH